MAGRRVATLQGHLAGGRAAAGAGGGLAASPCAAAAPTAIRQLPRFDVTIMESFLDTHRQLKLEFYELFRQHPELLVAEEEGLSKGGWSGSVGGRLGVGCWRMRGRRTYYGAANVLHGSSARSS